MVILNNPNSKKMMQIFSKETPFTTLFGIIALGISMLIYLGVLEVYDVYFNRELIFQKHEFWRLITSLFYYGPMSLEVVISVCCFLQYCHTTEASYFANRPCDFLFFCLFGMISMWIFSSFYPLIFLGQGVSSYFTYYSAKRAPDALVIAFIFPVPMPAPFLNLFFLGLHLVTKQYQAFVVSIVGYLSAHAYFYLQDILSLKYGFNLLTAPQSFNQALNNLFNIV